MEEFMKSEWFIVGVLLLLFMFVTIMIILLCKFNKLSKKYRKFISKFEDGINIEEDLENYAYKVKKVEEQYARVNGDIADINNRINNCIKKVGIVRYNAFEDVGSNLSFVIALLNERNDGVILNGIYARESSNIFAKPIENGKCTYITSNEENEAIKKAINNEGIK